MLKAIILPFLMNLIFICLSLNINISMKKNNSFNWRKCLIKGYVTCNVKCLFKVKTNDFYLVRR